MPVLSDDDDDEENPEAAPTPADDEGNAEQPKPVPERDASLELPIYTDDELEDMDRQALLADVALLEGMVHCTPSI